MSKIYDVIVLGAGPAGLTAGLYAGRSRLSTLIIEKGQDGGQIAITNEIENYPGQQLEGESGPSLIARMTEQAKKFGCERVSDTIKSVDFSGKTKKLIDAINAAVADAHGDVVCIEKEKKLTFDIPYQARLIEAGSYDIGSYEFIKGFICGLHSGNYDITHVFVDNFYKIVSNKDPVMFGEFLDWLESFSKREKIEFVISVTIDPDTVGEAIRKYMI